MILPDGVYRREELSIEKIQRLMETSPEDIRLHDSSLNNLVDILERTDRADDASDVKKTNRRHPLILCRYPAHRRTN